MIEQQQLCHVLVSKYPQSKRPLLLEENTDSLGTANNSILIYENLEFEYHSNFTQEKKSAHHNTFRIDDEDLDDHWNNNKLLNQATSYSSGWLKNGDAIVSNRQTKKTYPLTFKQDNSTNFSHNFRQLEYLCKLNYEEKITYMVSYLLQALRKTNFLSKTRSHLFL